MFLSPLRNKYFSTSSTNIISTNWQSLSFLKEAEFTIKTSEKKCVHSLHRASYNQCCFKRLQGAYVWTNECKLRENFNSLSKRIIQFFLVSRCSKVVLHFCLYWSDSLTEAPLKHLFRWNIALYCLQDHIYSNLWSYIVGFYPTIHFLGNEDLCASLIYTPPHGNNCTLPLFVALLVCYSNILQIHAYILFQIDKMY